MVQNQTKKCPNGSGITRSPDLVFIQREVVGYMLTKLRKQEVGMVWQILTVADDGGRFLLLSQMLTLAQKRGGLHPLFLAHKICEQPLKAMKLKF